jgi:hypothetical protein
VPTAPENRYVTSDVSGSHTTTPGVATFGLNHDGVGDLVLLTTPTSGVRGTASLLPTGLQVITAAHVVTQPNSTTLTPFLSASVKFELSSGNVTIPVASVTVDPLYDGDTTHGHDLAVVTLSSVAPVAVPRYTIYTGGAEIGAASIKVGYGQTGIGSTGASGLSGTKRAGKNEYDADSRDVLSALGGGSNPFAGSGGILPPAGTTLAYDFDSGVAANNALSFAPINFGSDLGFGADEVNSAPGDSGGPTFISNGGIFQIAGITSYGFGFGAGGPDVSPGTNSSWGEVSVDMRLGSSAYTSFLAPFVPEPVALPVLTLAVTLVCGRRRRLAA